MSTACCERAEERELTAQELVEDLGRRPVAEQVDLLSTKAEFESATFVAQYASYLDSLRYDEPRSAARLAEVIITRVLPGLEAVLTDRVRIYCEFAGLYSSSQRLLGRYELASAVLRRAIELADLLGLKSCTAELLSKAAYLMRDQGFCNEAYELMGHSLRLFAENHDLESLSNRLVDRGIMGHYAGKDEEASSAFEAALQSLPESQRRARASAYAGLAAVFEARGELSRASESVARAASLVEGKLSRASLMWQQGELAFSIGELRESERLLREAKAALGASNPFDAALVSVDLVKTLFALGEVKEATAIAKTMASLLTRVRQNPLFSASILSLTRDALRGAMTISLIEKTRAAIMSARERTEGEGRRRPTQRSAAP